MTDHPTLEHRILLGDPVPWFSAAQVNGGAFDLHASAGRWVVLAFMGSLQDPRAGAEIAQLLQQADLFSDDHLVVACLFTAPPENLLKFADVAGSRLLFLADYDGAIHRAFGALAMPRTVVLDPMLRAIADIAWDYPQGHAGTVRSVLRSLPRGRRFRRRSDVRHRR